MFLFFRHNFNMSSCQSFCLAEFAKGHENILHSSFHLNRNFHFHFASHTIKNRKITLKSREINQRNTFCVILHVNILHFCGNANRSNEKYTSFVSKIGCVDKLHVRTDGGDCKTAIVHDVADCAGKYSTIVTTKAIPG